tara:strand:+ start:2719 stop:2862 length:144 start_codon:yes stop_codon:yes gene_type:complete
MKIIQTTNARNILLLRRKRKEIKKERFEIKSILGRNVAGMTSKLENI